jgi:DNA-binding MarR family transcriptional regulator
VNVDEARGDARGEGPTADPAVTPAARRTRHGDMAEDMIERIIGYRLAMASIPTRQLFNRHVGDVLKLRPVDFTLLALIRANPDVTAKRLSQALAISAPRLTPILERLERRGLIRRERSEADRRAQHIALTETGEHTITRGLQLSLRAEAAHFAALSPAERAMLVELLAKVAVLAPQ